MSNSGRRPKVLVIVEAHKVTGPVKNLMDYCRWCSAQSGGHNLPEFTLATFSRTTQDRVSQFASEVERAGIRLHFISERGRFDHKVIDQLKRLVELTKPDIIQTHSVKSHFLVRLAGLPRRRPWIIFHHGYTTTDWKMRLYNLLDRWSVRAASCIVTVCFPFAAEMQRIGVSQNQIRIVHNAIRPAIHATDEAVGDFRRTLAIAEGVPIILTVGRLSDEKGHRDLLVAFRKVIDDLEGNFHLVILGEGPELSTLEKSIQQLGLKGRVSLAGHLQDPSTAYSVASIFVLPSHREGSPNALLEAMAYGLPIVSCAVGGVPEIATDQDNALLVPPRSPMHLAAAMLKLLSDPKLGRSLGVRARTRAESFTTEVRAAMLSQIYREVANVDNDVAGLPSNVSAVARRTK
jgi:glycosyltransferase involved in cell wall biosynthesis